MPFYEYKVVPAPAKAPKMRGLKGPARFASGLETLMNELAREGWEYHRAESLPDTESRGFLAGSTEVTRTVLVFRRELVFEDDAPQADTRQPDPAPEQHRVDPDDPAPPAEAAAPQAPGAWRSVDEDAAGGTPPEPDRSEPPRFSRRPLVAERKDDA